MARQELGAVLAGIAALTALYALVFALSDGAFSQQALIAALANAVPAMLIGWLVASRIAPLLWPVRLARGGIAIATTLILYALVTYVMTIVLLALAGGDNARAGGLFIRYFTGPAFIWQSFQGLAYGGIALLTGWLMIAARERGTASDRDAGALPAPAAPLGRLLLRTDQGIAPVDAEDIICIHAADDYCEVILPGARHLARMTMSECERLLANEPMVRVHRSHLVNLRRLTSAEPTGDGRLLLTLSNGERVTSSRAGARIIRDRSG